VPFRRKQSKGDPTAEEFFQRWEKGWYKRELAFILN